MKHPLSDFFKKHTILPFAVACLHLLGLIVFENINTLWWNHHAQALPSNLFFHIEFWLLVTGTLLFPIGLVWLKRDRLFSEYWLGLILEAFIFACLESFSIRPIYMDNPYYDQPLFLVLENSSMAFIAATVIQGPILLGSYYFLADKRERKVTIIRRLCLTLLAIGISLFLYYCHFWLWHT